MSLTNSPRPVLDFDELFTRHSIHPTFRAGFRALTAGVPPSKDLKTRIETVSNYRDCLDDILTRLSQPFAHLFQKENT